MVKLYEKFSCSVLIQQNGMAMYPKFYIEPVFKKEAQQELVKSGEITQYTHLPVKPALNHHTCSASYDPLLA